MNYFKMFKDVGIIDNDSHVFNMCAFDNDNNCQKSSDAVFKVIEEVYSDNDFKTDLYGFIRDLKNLYQEVGVNLGCLFIERNHKKEFSLNDDTNKLEMKNILSLNGYIDLVVSFTIIQCFLGLFLVSIFMFHNFGFIV